MHLDVRTGSPPAPLPNIIKLIKENMNDKDQYDHYKNIQKILITILIWFFIVLLFNH